MSDLVIEVSNISKEFRIPKGEAVVQNTTLTEAVLAKMANLSAAIRGRRLETPSVAKEESIWALEDVTFNVERGSRLGILGRNGAGKSTLLKLLSRITEPTSGHINVKGKVISLLEIGVGFHQELTGRENIFLNGAVLGMKKKEIKARFAEIVDFAEIETFLDTPVKRYSSGMYMKLAFSIAAHLDPEILVVDEVLAVGDAQFQKKCLAKMEEISREEGRTVLCVSHNIDAIRKLCTQGIFLDKGRLIAQGDIQSVAEQYVLSYAGYGGKFVPQSHKPVFFSAIRLVDNPIQFGEDLVIECEVISNQFIADFAFGLGISNSLDMRVASSLLFSPRPVNRGLNSFKIQLPIHAIVPGDYKLTIALASNDVQEVIDVVVDYPAFTIVADEANRYLFSKWQSSFSDTVLKARLI